jgi:hypothetical protein
VAVKSLIKDGGHIGLLNVVHRKGSLWKEKEQYFGMILKLIKELLPLQSPVWII